MTSHSQNGFKMQQTCGMMNLKLFPRWYPIRFFTKVMILLKIILRARTVKICRQNIPYKSKSLELQRSSGDFSIPWVSKTNQPRVGLWSGEFTILLCPLRLHKVWTGYLVPKVLMDWKQKVNIDKPISITEEVGPVIFIELTIDIRRKLAGLAQNWIASQKKTVREIEADDSWVDDVNPYPKRHYYAFCRLWSVFNTLFNSP